jgi:hypothetical protein
MTGTQGRGVRCGGNPEQSGRQVQGTIAGREVALLVR